MQASLVKDCILHFGGFLCLVFNIHHKHQGPRMGLRERYMLTQEVQTICV